MAKATDSTRVNSTHICDRTPSETLAQVTAVFEGWKADEHFGDFTSATIDKGRKGDNVLRVEATGTDGGQYELTVTGQVNFGFDGNGARHAADILAIAEAFGTKGEIEARLFRTTSDQVIQLTP